MAGRRSNERALGFFFDTNKCIGCRTCHVACKDLHNLNLGPITRKVRAFEVGSFPNVDGFRLAESCYHCTNARCIRACPTAAIYRAEDGTVQVNQELCIGCAACVPVCPYGAPQMDTDKRVMVKCDSCIELRAAGQNPVCVDACLMRCIDFGTMGELAAKHGPGLVSELPVMPSSRTTNPNVVIKAKPVALRRDFREVEI